MLQQLSKQKLTKDIIAVLRNCSLSLKGPSTSVKRRVMVVRASVHALLPIDMKVLRVP